MILPLKGLVEKSIRSNTAYLLYNNLQSKTSGKCTAKIFKALVGSSSRTTRASRGPVLPLINRAQPRRNGPNLSQAEPIEHSSQTGMAILPDWEMPVDCARLVPSPYGQARNPKSALVR